MPKLSRIAFACLLAISPLAAKSLPREQQAPQRQQIFPEIRISINSGMPDPAFRPSQQDVDRLVATIAKLPAGNTDKGLYQNLGYRGFNLLLTATKVITVYRDTIEIRTWTTNPPGSTAVYKRDDARKVEAELLRLAENSGALESHVRSEIESGKDNRPPAKK
jgi:hypothetical protein